MFVKSLNVQNFRNYENISIDLSPGINVFYGNNAQGKTNLLEAVYLLATARSHRTTNEKECIRQGKDEAILKVVLDIRGKEEKIDIHLRKTGRKTIQINGYPITKISELIGRMHVVVFSPEDLSLIKNGPTQRRKFIDMEISQVDPIYLYNLQQYYKVLRQRNHLLKNVLHPSLVQDTIFAWDEQLSHYGVLIMKRRKTFVEQLEVTTAKIHESITKEKEKLTIFYDHAMPMEEGEYLSLLKKNLEKDMKYGTTGCGVQHDDMILYLNGADVRIYGSQGQQRTTALSLKLAEMRMMREEVKDDPILLLDDVMSELDKDRQIQLAEYIKNSQTIITCTGIEDSIKQLPSGKMFYVENGMLTEDLTMEETV